MKSKPATLLFFTPFVASAGASAPHADISRRSGAGPEGSPWRELACSAVGELVRANGNRLPKDMAEWSRLFSVNADGRNQEVFVPFSRSINRGSPARPRGLLTSLPTEGGLLSSAVGEAQHKLGQGSP